MINVTNIGWLIKTSRLHAGLTQAKLAARVSCSPATISQIENGKYSPRFYLVQEMLHECGVILTATFTDRRQS